MQLDLTDERPVWRTDLGPKLFGHPALVAPLLSKHQVSRGQPPGPVSGSGDATRVEPLLGMLLDES